MRRISAAAAIGIAALSLTACGGSPDDADKDDFCKAYTEFQEAATSAFMGEGDADKVDDALDELRDVGTPEEIDGEAREGFEVALDAYDDIDWDADDLEEEIDKIDDDMDSDDEDKADEFDEKAGEICDAD